MYVLVRYASLRRLQVVLGLALMALVVAPSASGAAQLDTVTATGSGTGTVNIDINAQSGISGQNPSGTVAFGVVFPSPQEPVVFPFSGPVTCLTVTGPDHGAGAPGAPTTAVLNFQEAAFGVVTVGLVDNGGNGADIIRVLLPVGTSARAPTDCSPLVGGVTDPLLNGRAVVFDAPLLPTSKAQCKNGGWRNFGTMFKNQGQCVAFVRQQARQQPRSHPQPDATHPYKPHPDT